jgi:hypothetical protein
MGDFDGFPGYTEWSLRQCCCVQIETVPALRSNFWRHWEIRPFLPILVFILSLLSFALLFAFVIPHFGVEGWLVAPVLAVVFVLFLLNYLRTIVDGPGYFPFYWAAQDVLPPPTHPQGLLLSRDEAPDGIISTDEQHAWAAGQRKPPRSILSRTARRIVLRPDHFCAWAAVWIGKRNAKFFMLMNLYSFLYFVLFVVYVARHFVRVFTGTVSLASFALAASGLAAGACALANISFVCAAVCAAFANRTTWEQWKGIDAAKFDRGIKTNLEDVCGTAARWWTWPLPMSPWKGKSNAELAAPYVSYYD